MNWNDFTPQEFIEYCKDIFTENILPKLHAFYDGIYNISTWLEDLVSKRDI